MEISNKLYEVFSDIKNYKIIKSEFIIHENTLYEQVINIIENNSPYFLSKITEKNLLYLNEGIYNYDLITLLKEYYSSHAGGDLTQYNIDKKKFRTHFIAKISIRSFCKVCGAEKLLDFPSKNYFRYDKECDFTLNSIYDSEVCSNCKDNEFNKLSNSCSNKLKEIEETYNINFMTINKLDYNTFKIIKSYLPKIFSENTHVLKFKSYNPTGLDLYVKIYSYLYKSNIIKFSRILFDFEGDICLEFKIHKNIKLNFNLSSYDVILEQLIDFNWQIIKNKFDELFKKNIEFSEEFENDIRISLKYISLSTLHLILFWIEEKYCWAKFNINNYKIANWLKGRFKKYCIEYDLTKYNPENYVKYFEIKDELFLFLKELLPEKTSIYYKISTPLEILDNYMLNNYNTEIEKIT